MHNVVLNWVSMTSHGHKRDVQSTDGRRVHKDMDEVANHSTCAARATTASTTLNAPLTRKSIPPIGDAPFRSVVWLLNATLGVFVVSLAP